MNYYITQKIISIKSYKKRKAEKIMTELKNLGAKNIEAHSIKEQVELNKMMYAITCDVVLRNIDDIKAESFEIVGELFYGCAIKQFVCSDTVSHKESIGEIWL